MLLGDFVPQTPYFLLVPWQKLCLRRVRAALWAFACKPPACKEAKSNIALEEHIKTCFDKFFAFEELRKVFFPPIVLIRKNFIIKKLSQCGAFTEETAKTFSEAGILNPNGFKKVNEMLEKQRILVRTKGNKYYLNR